MKHFRLTCAIGLLLALTMASEATTPVVVVTGAPGGQAYADQFARWTDRWEKATSASGDVVTKISADDKDSLAHLRAALEKEPKEAPEELWLVLLGHGSFDGREGKFNLTGDDLAVSDLATMLRPFTRPVVVVCAFSASGSFLKPLSAPNRIIVTATKSGAENNFAHFGEYLSEAIADPAADLDKDGQTSLLEAWLTAAQRTADFYRDEGRLATEHTLLDDNGDGFGTPSDWFQGLRVVKKSTDKHVPDGLRAGQIFLHPSAAERALPPAVRQERDGIEREIAELRDAKATLPEEEYFTRLEALLLRLAKLYRAGKPDGLP